MYQTCTLILFGVVALLLGVFLIGSLSSESSLSTRVVWSAVGDSELGQVELIRYPTMSGIFSRGTRKRKHYALPESSGDPCTSISSKKPKLISNERKHKSSDHKIKYILLDEALEEWELHHYVLECTNIEHIPKSYIIADNYKEVFSHLTSSTDSILVTGPKGVGKTLSLIAIWIKLKHLGTATLFTSVFALKRLKHVPVQEYNERLLQEYMAANGNDDNNISLESISRSSSNYIRFITTYLKWYCKKNKLVLFVDLGNFDSTNHKVIDKLCSLVNFKNKNLQIVVALSSGCGINIGSANRTLYSHVRQIVESQSTKIVCFRHFNKREAKKCLKRNDSPLNLDTVVPYTGFNPKLLCLAAKCKQIADVDKEVNMYVHNFVRQNLCTPEVLAKSYLKSLMHTEYYFYASLNGLSLHNDSLCEFKNSWVFLQNICFITQQDHTSYRVSVNFPTLPQILRDDWKELVGSEMNISYNPVVKGYMLEEWFFEHVRIKKKFSIYCSTKGPMEFCVIDVLTKQQVLSHTLTSVLYKLRYAHPAIDGVGFLTETSTNKVWLVFIQVSLSNYQHHNSKLKDLFKQKSDYGIIPYELKEVSGSIMEYYAKMQQYDDCIFLYLSPAEVASLENPTVPQQLLRDRQDELNNVGVIYTNSLLHSSMITKMQSF